MVRALFPGTFDPIHFGHIDIAYAPRLFDEVVMAVYDKPLKSLMFSPEERMELVRQAFDGNPKIKVTGYSGLTVEFARQIEAQVIVRGLRVLRLRVRVPHGAGKPAPGQRYRNGRFHHGRGTYLPFLEHGQGNRFLGGDVSSMVPAHVDMALKKKS